MLSSSHILLNTDSYKVSMWKQYPPGTEYVYSYIESRGGPTDDLVFFGLQAFIKEYLTTPITFEDVQEANMFWTAHGEPFNCEGWEYIVEQHGGRLPLLIRSAEEGSVIPLKNVLVTVVNTDPKLPWLTTWVETAMLRAIWYASTVATNSREIKKVIKRFMEFSGSDMGGLDFKLHDFGARGVSSLESASIGAMAHLINFKGTDTVAGIWAAHKFYGADLRTTAFSVPATEHSTITSWGRENEALAYEAQIDNLAVPGGIVSVVSDSYNIYEAAKMWVVLKDKLKASGATLVIRPDSGEPTEVLRRLMLILADGFGYTTNNTGFKLLDGVRVLWGDGINRKSIQAILSELVGIGSWSADNFVFGMGGALLGAPQRDDYKFAMKASAARIGGQWVDVFKDPITDHGKLSKKGRVILAKANGKYFTRSENASVNGIYDDDCMRTVFMDGDVRMQSNFEEVRANASL